MAHAASRAPVVTGDQEEFSMCNVESTCCQSVLVRPSPRPQAATSLSRRVDCVARCRMLLLEDIAGCSTHLLARCRLGECPRVRGCRGTARTSTSRTSSNVRGRGGRSAAWRDRGGGGAGPAAVKTSGTWQPTGPVHAHPHMKAA